MNIVIIVAIISLACIILTYLFLKDKIHDLLIQIGKQGNEKFILSIKKHE